MTRHIPKELPSSLVDRTVFVIVANTMPPRDPDEEEDDADEEEDKDRDDEPPVVREPDED